MKRKLTVFAVSIFILIIASLSAVAAVETDNSKFVPKVITTQDFGYKKMVFDSELARASHKLSLDSYKTELVDGKINAPNFKKEGFEDIQQRNTEGEEQFFVDNFKAGVKTFEINGKKKHILAIAVKGTDWEDAHDVITDISVFEINGFHFGFYSAAVNVYESLCNMQFSSLEDENGNAMTFQKYLENVRLNPDRYYILVTGHSMGGAIANILTGELLAEYGKNNVMCYTFASPIVATYDKAADYNAYNIFNIINTEDIVPYIGVNFVNGVRLGEDLRATVTADEGDTTHTLKTTYDKVTELVIDDIDMWYHFAYRKKYTALENDTQVVKDELHIAESCSLDKGYFPEELGNLDLVTFEDVIINTDIITNGDFVLENGGMRQRVADIRSDSIRIGGNLRMGDVHLEVNDATIIIDGNLDNLSSISMKSDKGYLKINGDFLAAKEWSGRFEATAGTLEVKGDIVNATGYSVSGTHKLILSGDRAQKIDMEYDGRLSVGRINNLEITNTSEEGVNFVEWADVTGELYLSEDSEVVNGQNIFLTQNASIRGVWNGDLSASGWTSDKPCVINGNLQFNDCIDKESSINDNVIVNGEIRLLNNAVISVSDGIVEAGSVWAQPGGQLIFTGPAKMTVNGDFALEAGSILNVGYGEVTILGDFNKPGSCVMENDEGYLLVCGDLNNEEGGFGAIAGILEVKGNINDFKTVRASETHKLILSGDGPQKIDAGNGRSDWDVGEISSLEIKNTSEAGVEFLDYIVVLNDVLQTSGAEIAGREYVFFQGKQAFVDYGKINSLINEYNGNPQNLIPTWLDYEKYYNFKSVGNKAFTLNEEMYSESFKCDLYFEKDYKEKTAAVMIAFYDGNGSLVQLASSPVVIVSDKIDFEMNFENKSYSTYKLMIWGSFDNLKPLMALETE